MKKLLYLFASILLFFLVMSCNTQNKENKDTKHLFTGADGKIELIVLDPGHFHASLLQKFPQNQVNDTVLVFAPEGDELHQYLQSIDGYNQRVEDPTDWHEVVYAGSDYLEKMIEVKKGNVVVLAGNNAKKTDYILRSINAGFNLLSDKPMAINREGFELLKAAFNAARERDLYLYDVMTERYDIINTLTRELVNYKSLFGDLQEGTPNEPAINLVSVHHFFKEVSGNRLVRPAWFYDVEQQGEGIVDVATHLIDLVNWQCFPEQVIDYNTDVTITGARHWATKLTMADFTRSTNLEIYPEFLKKYLKEDTLCVYANGSINYQVKGKNIAVTALWNYQAPPGGGDTHNALFKGTLATVEIVQNEAENYINQLYIEKNPAADEAVFEATLQELIAHLQQTYPYISTQKIMANRYQIIVPVENRKGHEDYFGMVASKFFQFLVNREMPEWEITNTLTKYFITTSALEIAKAE